ncbi:unnamed protein product [Penicillium salamii]|uniref:Protein kinase domain-containing protein n=1 Tax=Penicillium salamii TaxID=1612424 RepID=A0A9W4N8C3_9EURO|nr:unnamed protein product [Penicillium salamii]
MKTTRHFVSHFSTLLCQKPSPLSSLGPFLPPGILVDEEISPVDWGVSSTIWLARDLQGPIGEPEIVVALKIANNNATSAGHEREVEEHIAMADPSHRGRSVIRTLLDSFEVKGPEGPHSCLIYSPMREPLSIYQRHFADRRMPLPLIKTYIRALLTGLDYLHRECRTVHTDLKLENIMVSFEDPSVISDFMDSQLKKTMAFKIDSLGRPVYQSRNDFGPLKSLRSIPQLVDFGMATRLEEDDDWGVWPIQPDHYRAPEVILGNGWQMPADIWSLGVLLWDMIEGKELFRHIHDDNGCYDAKLHLAEMTALLGPPPSEVIQRYQSMREYLWPEPVKREDGRVCGTAEEYFSGPFYDKNGRFLFEDQISDRKLEDTAPFLDEKEREVFLDFAKGMLAWHPNWRKTAGELMGHLFLQSRQTSA